MKRFTYLVLAIALLIGVGITFDACKKEEDTNQPPTCLVTAPTNGQEIKKGETVIFSVEANDSDGNITEVSFFIDGVGKSSANSLPYNYEWETDNESIGSHILKATSIDNDGDTNSEEITVEIIQAGSAPFADFNADTNVGLMPLTVNFTDLSLNNPTSWQWDFGDGGISSQQNPSYTFSSTGIYTVELTVTNSYGSDTEVKTDYITVSSAGGTFTDPRDGQTYNIVTIGDQIWFAENLNYETGGSWCYDDDSNNCDVYGRLYTWNAALNACPDGWHLPSDYEWKTLEMYLGMSQSDADSSGWRGTDEGGKMKEAGNAHWRLQNTGATNSSGFTALPGGAHNFYGNFYFLGSHGNWWTATETYYYAAWYRNLHCTSATVYRRDYDKDYGFSVRCVRY